MLDAVVGLLAQAGVGRGARLCCALSGGVDSVVLLQLLHELRPRLGFELAAAHVHHGLSPRADDWLAFCATLSARLGLAFLPFHVEVARDDPAGLEAAARRARHAALDGVGCDWLAFGHHQDDQAETLLFRLLRGTGVHGAAAMRAFERGSEGRPGRLRPLLGVRRAAVEAWARARGLQWVEDESNADCRFARNDIRHRLLPVAEKGFPAAVPALARAAEHFREADELLDALAGMDQAACGGVGMAREALLALGDARAANLLRWQARRLGGRAPSRARLHEALRQLRETHGQRALHVSLGDLACCGYRGKVWLEPVVAAEADLPQRWRGEARLEWGQGAVHFVPSVGRGLSRTGLEGAAVVQLVPRSPGLRLRADARRPSRSFKNLCQEAGIPAWLRDRLPVLEIDGEVAWIGAIGVAASFACEPGAPGIEPQWEPSGNRSDGTPAGT
jgi:tRNA(Ile)-lysidine synthase